MILKRDLILNRNSYLKEIDFSLKNSLFSISNFIKLSCSCLDIEIERLKKTSFFISFDEHFLDFDLKYNFVQTIKENPQGLIVLSFTPASFNQLTDELIRKFNLEENSFNMRISAISEFINLFSASLFLNLDSNDKLNLSEIKQINNLKRFIFNEIILNNLSINNNISFLKTKIVFPEFLPEEIDLSIIMNE